MARQEVGQRCGSGSGPGRQVGRVLQLRQHGCARAGAKPRPRAAATCRAPTGHSATCQAPTGDPASCHTPTGHPATCPAPTGHPATGGVLLLLLLLLLYWGPRTGSC